MSVVSCLLLSFLILCVGSLHFCNARSLSLIGRISKENEKEMLPRLTKNDLIHNNVRVLQQSVTTTKTKENMNVQIDDNNMKKQIRFDEHNLKGSKTQELKGKGTTLSNSKQDGDHGSLVSVSWRVPRNKIDEKQPGFNLDYSPPREHPGHHN